MSVILRHGSLDSGEIGVVCGAHGHVVAYGIAADDESAGVDADVAHRALQHLGILDGVGFLWIQRCLCLGNGRNGLDDILQIHLQPVWQAVRNSLAEGVGLGEGIFLHACHILDGVLRSHRAVGDDVGAVLVPILVHDPPQHFAAAIIVKVGVNIRQRDTVGVEETLEQQVILQRVKLRYAETVCHDASCCTATTGADPHAQLRAGRVYEVLHNEEVSREAHRLHDV